MMLGLTTTRRLCAEVAAAKAETDRIRDERDAALEDTSAAKAAARTAACQFVEADEKYVDVRLANQRLTEDLAATRRELAAVRKVEESLARQIHEMAQPVEPSDEEVDAAQLRLELDAERSRVAHLEKELDNACGMPPGGILNSAPWQPGYKAERDKEVAP